MSRDATTDLILDELPFLERLAAATVRQQSDVDDLVQETVFRAFRARDRFRPGSQIRAWLATILARACLTAALTKKRRATAVFSDAGPAYDDAANRIAARENAPDQGDLATVEEHLDEGLRRALLRLSPCYREPFCLYVLRGLTYPEIAAQMSIPVGTVMSRIFRARAQLRTELEAKADAKAAAAALRRSA